MFACASAVAQPSLVAQAVGPGFSLVSGTTPQTASVSAAGSYPLAPGASGSSSATAFAAGYGLLHSTSDNQQSGGWNDYLGTRSSADAAWYDDLIVSPANPLLNGTPGTLTVTLRVTGTLSASFSGSVWNELSGDVPTASGGIQVYLNSAFLAYTNNFVQATGIGPRTVNQSVDRTEVVVVPFTFGQWFNFGITLSTISSITSYTPQANVLSAAATSNDWTCWWGGVNGVSSQGGGLGSGAYTLSSLSGTDYLAVIPAPGAPALAALGALVLSRRKR